MHDVGSIPGENHFPYCSLLALGWSHFVWPERGAGGPPYQYMGLHHNSIMWIFLNDVDTNFLERLPLSWLSIATGASFKSASTFRTCARVSESSTWNIFAKSHQEKVRRNLKIPRQLAGHREAEVCCTIWRMDSVPPPNDYEYGASPDEGTQWHH